MEIKMIKALRLDKEEREVLEKAIAWYEDNFTKLEDYGMNLEEDLYHIFEDVLREDRKNSINELD